VLHDLPMRRHALQSLGHVLAELAEFGVLVLTTGADGFRRIDDPLS
jgi:hypothetical protein